MCLPDPEPRPYGFRQFSERRARQDRRLFHRDDDGAQGGWGFRRGRPGHEGREIFVRLTRDSLRVLLDSVDRASKYDRFS